MTTKIREPRILVDVAALREVLLQFQVAEPLAIHQLENPGPVQGIYELLERRQQVR